jgi:hypothetical protein
MQGEAMRGPSKFIDSFELAEGRIVRCWTLGSCVFDAAASAERS